jgi:hypothetical protein
MPKAGFLLSLLMSAIVPTVGIAQTPADLARAVQARDQAIEAGDIVALERWTAADLTAVAPDGRLLDRAGYLAALGGVQLTSLTNEPLIYIDGIRLRNGVPSSGSPTNEPLIYLDGIRLRNGVPSSGCSREYLAMLANGRAALRHCLRETGWWLEVWEKRAPGWQVVGIQGTAPTK